MKTDFRNHFTIEAHKSLMAFMATEPTDDSDSKESTKKSEWYKSLFKKIEEEFDDPFRNFLMERKKNGEMQPFTNAEGYESNFLCAWQSIVEEDAIFKSSPEQCWSTVCGAFQQMCSMEILAGRRRYNDEGTVSHDDAERYDRLIKMFDEGNFRWSQTDMRQQCWITGESMVVQFSNWQGTLGTTTGPTFETRFVPVKPNTAADELQHQKLVFKTGNLLVADWFRIDEFTQAAKKSEARKSDVNSEHGCALTTKAHAEKLGMVHVSVSNTSPEMLLGPEGFIFSSCAEDDAPKRLKSFGPVCTDLWWVSMIEREQLVSVIAGELGDAGVAKAESLVADYLKQNDVIEVIVPPGTYHLYSHGNHERFASLFNAWDFDVSGIEKPYFVLSNKELVIEPLVKPTGNETKKRSKTI